jgi:hypothetical protein
MTSDEIYKLIEANGLTLHGDIEHFAALVASAEREKHKWDIHSCSPTCNRYSCVAIREAVLAEREACAKLCDSHWEKDGAALWCANAIRARGQHD